MSKVTEVFYFVFVMWCTLNVCLIEAQRRLRSCRSSEVDVSLIEIENITFNFETNVLKSDDHRTNLSLTVTWNVNNVQGLPFDGFIINLFNTNAPDTVIPPLNVCGASPGALWFNQSSCPNDVPPPSCPVGVNPVSSSCLCPAANCDITGPVTCRGTPFYVTESGGNLISVDNTVRSYAIAAEFHTSYQISIQPYYRQFITLSADAKTGVASDCHSLVAQSEGISLAESIQLCCESDIPHFIPLMLKISSAEYNFTNGETQITFTWRPPVFQDESLDFNIQVFSTNMLSSEQMPMQELRRIIPIEDQPALSADCYNSTYAYQASISNLFQPNIYHVSIQATYSQSIRNRYCSKQDDCAVRTDLDLSAINLCEEQFSICGDGTTCQRRTVNESLFRYSCKSNSGNKPFVAVSMLTLTVQLCLVLLVSNYM